MPAHPLATTVTRDDALFAEISESLLRRGLSVRFRAEGASMQPTIADGEPLIVAPFDTDDRIARGDIVLCRLDAGLVAHRVVSVVRVNAIETVTVRGDAKAACDAPVRRTDILAKVIAVERNGRRVALTGLRARARYVINRTSLRIRTAATRVTGRM